jgi:hypothetical protein
LPKVCFRVQLVPTATTREFILARAVVDAVAGDGGAFWAAYSGVMPPPESLAHPFLLSEDLLAELEDDALAEEGRWEAGAYKYNRSLYTPHLSCFIRLN